MAYFAAGFLTLGTLASVMALPWLAPLLVLPILAAWAVARFRTVADSDTVTARTMLGSTTVDWEAIEGLKFVKSSWARAKLTDGSELMLPAVTFSSLPRLAEISGGRVPNPYQ